jgi:hypothetical protein
VQLHNEGHRPRPRIRKELGLRLKPVIAIVGILTLVLVAATVGVGTGSAPDRASSRPAPHFAHPTHAARRLVVRFFASLERKDVAGLRRFLSPAFQVERADASGSGKAAYLKNLPTIEKFRIRHLHGTQAGRVLVARYRATVKGVVNGHPYTPGPAPRLSAFDWTGNRWQLSAHANFNPLKG